MLTTAAVAFEHALNLHQTGHLDKAEIIYRQVLDGEPSYHSAWHLLGVVLQTARELEA